ncbi:L-glutamine synthetase [Thermomonospora echinospora]|uniref:L-glutamine synthetase n=1 Tax=Thermomonospora echinospora TaxID=1992 RepID=A0A1H6B121_9ACTN|nr:glutamine synthetase family protein [Thermomonospora echinospora]SEG54499.1 L-glutamine synthetase [Thermomonospora echinospora]
MNEQERAHSAARARAAARELAARQIVAVALTWVDTAGITRVKTVPVTRLEHAAAWGVGVSPVFDAYLADDTVIAGRYAGSPVGDLRLHPDLDRLTILGAPAGWAWAPADRYDQDGAAHPQDARALLRGQAARLTAQGLAARAAFEIEWAVSQGPGEEFVPAARGPAYGMTRIVELPEYLLDVLGSLAAAGVEVEQLHPEYAAGQYEVSVAAEDPVGAADTSVLVRQTIRAVTIRHGMRASFSPKVVADGVGNGFHVHLSLWRDGADLMAGGSGPYGMRAEAEAFAAGVLARLPALLAVGCPTVASYLRLVPSQWSGPFACWGLENREAALRFVTGPAGQRSRAANFEVKCFDAAADPYLLLTVLLAAGRDGLAGGARLPDPVNVDPASLDEAERAARHVARLPSSLAEAVAAFESDPVLREALGEPVAGTVVDVRRGEIARFEGAAPEEIAARTRWLH